MEVLEKLIILEEEIKSKKDKTPNDQKKLESLEMIKKEFKKTLVDKKKEAPKLVGEEKKLETKKENNKKTKSSKTSSKKKTTKTKL